MGLQYIELYFKEDFGKKLKSWRLEAKLTQIEVSIKLGYTSSQFISNWEQGKSTPPLEVISELCEIYKINERELRKILNKYHTEFLKRLI